MLQPFSGDDLKRERLSRALSYREFGIWLAQQWDRAKEPLKPSQPYSREQVYAWENKGEPIPTKVELTINWSWSQERLKDPEPGARDISQHPERALKDEFLRRRDEELESLTRGVDSLEIEFGAW